MRHFKSFGFVAIAGAGLVLSCATAKAQDPYGDRRDLRHDYAKVDRLRADIARDQHALDRRLRDIHRDRGDLYRDRRDRW